MTDQRRYVHMTLGACAIPEPVATALTAHHTSARRSNRANLTGGLGDTSHPHISERALGTGLHSPVQPGTAVPLSLTHGYTPLALPA
eukprot:1781847-Prymnesium_polylepis.1